MLLILLLLAHLKISILQKRFMNLYSKDLMHGASLDYVLEPERRAESERRPEPEQDKAQKHPEARNLDPECLNAFHKLTQAQKLELFACASSISDLLASESGCCGAFEPFWRACHSANTLESAKFFQDALLALSASKQELVKFYIKSVSAVPADQKSVLESTESDASMASKPEKASEASDEATILISTSLEHVEADAQSIYSQVEPKPEKKSKKGKTVKNKHDA